MGKRTKDDRRRDLVTRRETAIRDFDKQTKEVLLEFLEVCNLRPELKPKSIERTQTAIRQMEHVFSMASREIHSYRDLLRNSTVVPKDSEADQRSKELLEVVIPEIERRITKGETKLAKIRDDIHSQLTGRLRVNEARFREFP